MEVKADDLCVFNIYGKEYDFVYWCVWSWMNKENISICIYMLLKFVGVKEDFSLIVNMPLTSIIPLIRIQINPGIEMYYKNNFQEKEHMFNQFLHKGTLNPYHWLGQ